MVEELLASLESKLELLDQVPAIVEKLDAVHASVTAK